MKRIGSLILALVMLAGCQWAAPDAAPALREPEPTPQQSQEAAAPEPLEVIDAVGDYTLSTSPVPDRQGTRLLQPTADGAALVTLPSPDDADGSGQTVFLTLYDAAGDSSSTIALDEDLEVEAACCVGGAFSLLLSGPEGQLLRLPDGTEKSLDDLFSDGAQAQWLAGSTDGLLLLCPDGQAAALNHQGDVLWTERFSGEMVTAMTTAEETVQLLARWDTMAMLQDLDLATGRLTPVGSVPEALCSLSLTPGARWGYDLLTWDQEAVYGWRAGSTAVEQLLRWDLLEFDSDRLLALVCRSETELLAFARGKTTALEELTITPAAEPSWKAAYRTTLSQDIFSAGTPVEALGLTDMDWDGIPELAVWWPESTDGVRYDAGTGDEADQAFHNVGSIYPGAAPSADWVLRASEPGGLTEGEALSWLEDFDPIPTPALTDDALLDLVEPLEIATAKCGEFVFDDPSELSAGQLWMTFLTLADREDFKPYRNEYDTGYDLPPSYINSVLALHLDGATFAYDRSMIYERGSSEAAMSWSEDQVSGHRFGQVSGRRGDGETLTVTVDYYTEPDGQGERYLTKTYELGLGVGGYTYRSARIDNAVPAREAAAAGGVTPPADQLRDEALEALVLTPEICLVDEGFTFRRGMELGEEDLYLLFLAWSDYEVLETCYRPDTQMFYFPEEMIVEELARHLQDFSFDITQLSAYDTEADAVVTPLASGFGGDRAIAVEDTRVYGSVVEVDVGFYDNYELTGDPRAVKTYTLQYFEDGFRFLSAVRKTES